jgi:hypothetical protein
MPFVATHLANLSEIIGDSQFVQLTMGPNQDVYILSSDKNTGYRVHSTACTR